MTNNSPFDEPEKEKLRTYANLATTLISSTFVAIGALIWAALAIMSMAEEGWHTICVISILLTFLSFIVSIYNGGKGISAIFSGERSFQGRFSAQAGWGLLGLAVGFTAVVVVGTFGVGNREKPYDTLYKKIEEIEKRIEKIESQNCIQRQSP